VQEAFLKLWKAKGDEVDAVGPWLYTVCRNLAFDVMRKDRRMVIVDSVPEPVAPPQEAAGQTELAQALAALPPRDQEVVRLKFQSGLSYKDIARVTGLSESNIGVIIHNSIKKLREAAHERQ
jgi:RNA polymerase sigma-70 factor (ECF subfamily)